MNSKSPSAGHETQFTVAGFILNILRIWGSRTTGLVWRTRRLHLGLLLSALRRKRMLRNHGLTVPMGIGISPTMRCNLACVGCYSRFHPRSGELSRDVLDRTFHDAVRAGVFMFVVTGGEPYLRPELLELYRTHRRALFVTITNGTMLDDKTIGQIASLGNVIPIVSVEGTREQTDARRGAGVHDCVMRTMEKLHRAKVLFGFSTVLTRSNLETVSRAAYVRDLVRRGCTFGFYNEIIPVCRQDEALVPDEDQRLLFQERLAALRRSEPLVLVHLPGDEYDHEGRCNAVSQGGMHINAQGWVEPCPFAHFALENVQEQSFSRILCSPFLKAIREHPHALVKGHVGCALAGNRRILEEIALQTGARPTRPAEPEPETGDRNGTPRLHRNLQNQEL